MSRQRAEILSDFADSDRTSNRTRQGRVGDRASGMSDFPNDSSDSRRVEVCQFSNPSAKRAETIGDFARSAMQVEPANEEQLGAAEPTATCACSEPSPIGSNGQSSDRDVRGRFARGNLARLVVGDRSQSFWRAADEARREIRNAVITDAGFAEGNAPRALWLAADSITQSALIADSAFARLVESGGPVSSAGRPRRAFVVWLSATDRKERNLRLVGLRRVTRSAQSFVARVLAGQPQVDGPEGDQEDESDGGER